MTVTSLSAILRAPQKRFSRIIFERCTCRSRFRCTQYSFVGLCTSTSTVPNYYTGLIETSKTHFYGRAAAGLSFSDSVLRTFTRLWWAVSSFTQRRTTQFRHGIGPHGIEPRKSSTSAQQRPPPLQASPRADLHALALWLQLRRQTQLAGPNGLRSLPTPKYPRGCSFTPCTCSYCILAHFYGRAAAELSFSDLVLRTFTRTMKTVISYNNLELYLYATATESARLWC